MKPHIGSSVDSWLEEEGILDATTAAAIKRVLARQLNDAMEEQGITNTEMARRMQTSRAAVDRLLDPTNEAVTLSTLSRAAHAVGKELYLTLV